jgi:hypothetical protein
MWALWPAPPTAALTSGDRYAEFKRNSNGNFPRKSESLDRFALASGSVGVFDKPRASAVLLGVMESSGNFAE